MLRIGDQARRTRLGPAAADDRQLRIWDTDFQRHTLVLVLVVGCLGAGVVLGNTILTGLLTVTVGQAVLGRKETLGSRSSGGVIPRPAGSGAGQGPG
jgi:hypothetical protein